ncbi:MAG: ABC transporter ATP-binding protein [Phycisphaerales bacterium]|nr:ABC transporter ATP-binding protein [Phycisphaerales bacterium]
MYKRVMDAVLTSDLTKRYGENEVLKQVSLRVRAGSLFGFLGPNGAGKTTTIRILLGLLRASSGSATVLGQEAWSEGHRLRARVGYLPGDVRFYDGMTGRSTLAFINRARRAGAQREIERLASVFELDLGKRVRNYSRGMKQKLGILAAMAHRPDLLILDEPTTALDPLVKQVFNDELRTFVREGRTVLFSSHTLSEVEELCDEVAILRGGRIIEANHIDKLRSRAVRRVEVVFSDHSPRPAPPGGLRVARDADGVLQAAWTGDVTELIAWLGRCAVRDVTIAQPSLEDLFLAYYADTELKKEELAVVEAHRMERRSR